MKNGIFKFKHMLLLGSAITALSACETTPAANSNSQNIYATPDLAVNDLVTANRNGDKQALLKILGPQSEKLVYSGDPIADRQNQQKFIAAYDIYHRIDAEEDGHKDILVVGEEEWPVPIPLVRSERGWTFDTAEGEQAILDRRIGRNELNVIEVCRAYVEAQREYADLHKKNLGFSEYAQRINSTPGTHNGLYWPAKGNRAQSPLGPLMADAQAEGYDKISGGHHAPYQGYYFRILTAQGPAAAGGEKEYLVDGRMTKGFALLAFPASYRDSGIKSFIVNQNGIVYQADLGPDTAEIAAHMTVYNPDENWQPVD